MDALDTALERWFNFRHFRPGQKEVIQTLLAGEDAVVVMPTGSGKSLCFQLPALMMEGTTLVVSPLIALMKDQVDALVAKRIPATFLNSSISSDENARRLARLRVGAYKLVYVAPERFRNPRFLEALQATPLAMLAIDEAHCISTWGHDFRPDYLYLKEVVAQLRPETRLLAVTATATDTVRRDISEHLRLGEAGRGAPKVFVTGFERPNLALSVTPVRTHQAKLERLLQVIEFFRRGIVYCATRKMVERVTGLLEEHKISAVSYMGSMDEAKRTAVQDAFMHGQVPVVVATNAFGMGVDHPNIRFVVHWDIPGTLEAYYQEVGRAGRDGAYAWCELLFNAADVYTQEHFIEAANPPPEHVYELYAAIRNACAQEEHGEATLSPEAWAERAGIKSPLAVRNLVALFERNNLLRRTRKVGSPYSTITLPKEKDLSALQTICSSLSQKERMDRERLRTMLDYVRARSCRHRFLLHYFGEAASPKPCTKCDVCHPIDVLPPRRLPNDETLIQIRKVLSCVARLQAHGDYELVADILRGQAEAQWHQLSTFGILKERDRASIIDLCYALEMDGYLTGMKLTATGYDLVLAKHDPIPIATFQARTQKRILRGGLATALRQWVQEEATQRMLPTYMVMDTRTLAELAKKRPTTLTELALIPGMGTRRIDKYGERLIELIASYEN